MPDLTREQIEKMPAGPEMNALVAMRIMGWAITHRGRRVRVGQGHNSRTEGFEVHGFSGLNRSTKYIQTMAPKYSTSIADAWPLMLKASVASPNYDLPALIWDAEGFWACMMLDRNEVEHVAEAVEAPLAICRAALLASLDQ